MALLVDAGPLYAYVDADDDHHAECLELLETHPGPLLVPILVVTEVVYLLGTRLGHDAEVRFLGDLAAGNLIPEHVAVEDWLRVAELVRIYGDLPLGSVDSSVVAAAERLSISDVATLDRRHFTVVRPNHVTALNLLP
ncbi:MAG TPA: PIN domain-containing protein [Acidimicrobiales bacterium]|nr:PIN domain-containing protein [Acidimicrobiales bacterium]